MSTGKRVLRRAVCVILVAFGLFGCGTSGGGAEVDREADVSEPSGDATDGSDGTRSDDDAGDPAHDVASDSSSATDPDTDAGADGIDSVFAPTTLNCSDRIRQNESVDLSSSTYDNYTVVGDAVAVPGTARDADRARQVSATDDPKSGYFAKFGLVAKASAEATFVVPGKWRGRLAVGWGKPADFSREFSVPTCNHQFEWNAYPGGFWVSEPACVPLEVRHDGRTTSLKVGVGAACPGQNPPAGG